MKHTIYHGSINKVIKPVYGEGKKHNDYGLGFYTTEEIELAKEWAVSFEHDGYVNHYELEDNNLSILNLTNPEYNLLNWLAILLDNREFLITSAIAKEAKEYILSNFLIDYKKADIIIGYRADDSYFSFAQDFLNSTISYRTLSIAMKLGKLGEQLVLISPKAFDAIHYIDSSKVDYHEYYPKKRMRDIQAREQYLNDERYKRKKGDLFMINIIDEEIKNNDPRLQ